MDDYAKELAEAGYLKAYRDATWDRQAQKVFAFPGPAEWHPDSWVGRNTTEFITEYTRDAPLFMWASFSGPHYPFDPPADYLSRVRRDRLQPAHWREGEFDDPARIHHDSFHGGPRGLIDGRGHAQGGGCASYGDEYWQRLRLHYLANIAQIDDEIGRILTAAEARFGDSLCVVFTSDHGEMMGNHRLWGKQACGYEDVMRIAMLARMPGVFEAGVSDSFVSQVDLLPTFLGLAGVALPDRLDGCDLRDSAACADRAYAVSESRHFAAVTDGRFKYIQSTHHGCCKRELYDLWEDPYEFESLARRPECAPELARLQGCLLEHLGLDYARDRQHFGARS